MRRRLGIILLVMGVILAVAGVYLFKADRIYQASASIELSVRRPRILTQQAAVIEEQATSQSEEIFNTRLEKLKGATMLNQVVALYHKEHPDDARSLDELSKVFRGKAALALVRRTRLVSIQFQATDPQFAADACNAFARAAATTALDENRTASDAAVVWLEQQAVSQRAELEKADKALLKFRQENQLDALESQRKTVEESLLGFNKALVAIESEEVRAKDMNDTLEALDLKPENAGRLPASAPRTDELRSAFERWMQAAAERDALLSRYTARHPEVEAKD
jgi:polysaccharide biosynthesis transport protein